MESISPARRELRARAHVLHPVVLIGDKGLTDAVLHEIDLNLNSHELIKIRADAERDEREALLQTICERLGATPVQHIGKILVVYRTRPETAAPEPPARRPKKPKKRARRAPISAARGAGAKPERRRARTR